MRPASTTVRAPRPPRGAKHAALALAAKPKGFSVPAELDIAGASTLQQRLEGLLDMPERVQLDASEVQRVHSAALQLFCLFCRDRRAQGRDVEFLRPSPALLSAAALLGASTLLQLASVRS